MLRKNAGFDNNTLILIFDEHTHVFKIWFCARKIETTICHIFSCQLRANETL